MCSQSYKENSWSFPCAVKGKQWDLKKNTSGRCEKLVVILGSFFAIAPSYTYILWQDKQLFFYNFFFN